MCYVIIIIMIIMSIFVVYTCTGGEAVTFGWNEHGMCGNGSEESVLRPRPIGLSSVVAVGTGVGMTMAVI